MTTMEKAFRALQEPFPIKFLSWTIIATNKDNTDALVSPYIGRHHIMARFDDVLGPMNWQTGVVGQIGYLIKGIGIRTEKSQEWVWRWEPGVYIAATDKNRKRIEVLGSATVGLRRAAIEWGVGRYLKFITAKWVPYDSYAKKIREAPHIENINHWWALPYDHPVAVEEWANKNGNPIEELGKDDDVIEVEENESKEKTGKEPVETESEEKHGRDSVNLDEYFDGDGDGKKGSTEIAKEKDDPSQSYNYGDVMKMATSEMGWNYDKSNKYLADNRENMTPNQMVAEFEAAIKKGLGAKQNT